MQVPEDNVLLEVSSEVQEISTQALRLGASAK